MVSPIFETESSSLELEVVNMTRSLIIFAAAAHFVAWIGAVLNTAHLPDKTRFVVLLVVGLLGFVFIGTIAYVIAGPDGLEATEEASAPPQAGGASQPVSVSSMSWPGQHVASSAGGHPGSPANATRRNVGQHSSDGGSATA